MKPNDLQTLVSTAQREGLLPHTATLPDTHERPWPLTMLTALGAWMAAMPIFVLGVLLVGDSLRDAAAWTLLGLPVLACSVAVLCSPSVPSFVEQLAVPFLLAGMGLIGAGMADSELGLRGMGALLCLLTLAVGLALPQSWLRTLAGWTASGLAALALIHAPRYGADTGLPTLSPWVAMHLLLLAWLAALAMLHGSLKVGVEARLGFKLESFATGWLVGTLMGLALWSGRTFLLSEHLGLDWTGELAEKQAGLLPGQHELISVALAVAAASWLARAWPSWRQAWCVGIGLVLAALAAFMPSLGGALLVASVCATTRRWRLATLAAIAIAWLVGAFYYQLAWPLSTKALVLIGAAVPLAALALWGVKAKAGSSAAGADLGTAPTDHALSSAPVGIAGQPWAGLSASQTAWAFGLSVVAVLLAANGAIWQKESLIAHGQAVFVPMAPVDPRSLMQGDYMALNFVGNGDGWDDLRRWRDEPAAFDDPEHRASINRPAPRMVFQRDARGIATALRVDDGHALAAGEFVIGLTTKHGRWTLVTDAFYFREGEAEHWAAARYAEFRVDANGKALLVGLRGADLQAL